MGGRRTTKEELAQLDALTKEGLTCREIAHKLGRSPAAVRNLCYKKHLVAKARDETGVLFRQRVELCNVVRTLQGKKILLSVEVDSLRREKEKLEAAINSDKTQLQTPFSSMLEVS